MADDSILEEVEKQAVECGADRTMRIQPGKWDKTFTMTAEQLLAFKLMPLDGYQLVPVVPSHTISGFFVKPGQDRN